LFQPIERFSEETHIILFARNFESLWLLNVNDFIDVAIEKCSIDVHLVDLVLTTSEDCEEGADGGVFGDGSKSLIIVFPPALGEAFGAKAGFIEVVGILDG
jgi:hypothetical protein